MLAHVALAAASLASVATARTVHSVVVFSRHGDRSAKWYKGYEMTNLGSNQNYNAGAYFRRRYIEDGASDQIAGVSPDVARAAQIYASAPDQHVLFQTATNFLQGLYPPLVELDQELATEELVNGTDVVDPLDGNQFILVHGEDTQDPDTIWLKGADSCPAYTDSAKSYEDTNEYKQVLADSEPLYERVSPLLADIMGAENVSYAEAYDVWDLLHVASIHNASVAGEIDDSDLDQLRYLANEWEFNRNYNADDAKRAIGGESLLGGVLQQMEDVVADGAATKFTLLAGSYNTFLSVFGLLDLPSVSDNFTGLPEYAATLAFELFTDGDDEAFPSNVDEELRVRFLFRNGTAVGEELREYPLWGEEATEYTYGDFKQRMGDVSVSSVASWCDTCEAEIYFCAAERALAAGSNGSGSSLSNAAAGGIGAGVTAAVLLAIGAVIFVVMRRKSKQKAERAPVEQMLYHPKRTSSIDGESV